MGNFNEGHVPVGISTAGVLYIIRYIGFRRTASKIFEKASHGNNSASHKNKKHCGGNQVRCYPQCFLPEGISPYGTPHARVR